MLGGRFSHALLLAVVACVIIAAAARIGTTQLRDWLPVAMIPAAYWQMDNVRPVSAASAAPFDERWHHLDAWLLQHAGVTWWSNAVTSSVLETAYGLTYLIPALALGILYWQDRRDRVDRFYAVFLAGTLSAYALLPWSPSLSPRLMSAAGWQPPLTVMRCLNVWILDHADIHTSVFPSGHVAVAWSATFGLMAALPERKAASACMAALAALVAIATIYGRYHYAVDAIASLAVSVVAWRLESRVFHARPRRLPSTTASDSQSCS